MRLAENVEKHWKTNASGSRSYGSRTFMFQWQREDPFDPVNGKSRSSLWCPSGAEKPREKRKNKTWKTLSHKRCIWSIHNFPASVSMSNVCMCVCGGASAAKWHSINAEPFRSAYDVFFRLEVIAWAVGVELTSVQINAWNGSQTHSLSV